MRHLLGWSAAIATTVLAIACGKENSEEASPYGSSSGGGSSGSDGDGRSGSGSDGGSDGGSSRGDTCAAKVAQPQKAKADIIFVIDNSDSMTRELGQVKANVNKFADKIGKSGLDYRVIFIVARASSPTQTGDVMCVPPPLGGAGCADNPPRFWHIPQSIGSTSSLSRTLSTYDSADAALAWNRHLRPEAWKVFVEVTDDRSALAHTSFDQQLLAKPPAGMFGTAQARKYVFHSICSKPFADPIPSNNICSGAKDKSVDYQQLSKLTGGIVDEVCKTDYSGVLDNMAKGIVDKLGCELTYPTAGAADPTKLVVRFTASDGTPQNLTQVTDGSKCGAVQDGWHYDDNTAPTRIILCPTMCSTANASPNAKLEALVGCKAPAPK